MRPSGKLKSNILLYKLYKSHYNSVLNMVYIFLLLSTYHPTPLELKLKYKLNLTIS
jgi:hypothetical protein